MRKNRTAGHAQREADDYIDLGQLLSEVRDETDQEAVDAIVTSALSAKEKIRAIQALDEEGKSEPGKAGEGQYRVRALRYGPAILKDILLLPQTKGPYLAYVFGDHRRIVGFGDPRQVLESMLLPPHLRLHPAVPGFLSGVLKSWAAELSKSLALALEDGWRYLRRLEYNLLVVLKQLCDKIQSVNFGLLDFSDRNLIDKLRALEMLFFVHHYRPDYLELILSSLREAGNRDLRLADAYAPAAGLVTKLLAGDRHVPSLLNVLLGLNMLKYRRYLTLDQLICRDLGELVNTREYACTPEVRQKIAEIVVEGRGRLTALRARQESIRQLKNFLCFDEAGAVSFEPLRAMYDLPAGARARRSFAADRDNVAVAVPRLLEACDRTFYPLLNGHVRLEGLGNVTLFAHDFFQLDFLRIRRAMKKIEGLQSSHGDLPRDRFLELQGVSKGTTAVEVEALKNVNDSLEILCGTGAKVQAVLTGRRDAPDGRSGPLDPSVLAGRSFALPHEEVRITSPGVLKGMTVAEALFHFVVICNTLAVFLHYPPVYSAIAEETQVAAELRAQVESLSRLAGRGQPAEPAEVEGSPPGE